MRKLLLITLITCANFCKLNAQDFKIPEEGTLTNVEDYKEHEPDVLAAANWYLTTPVTEDKEKREKVGAFLFSWISGSPDVSVDLSQKLIPYMDNSECFMGFLSGWTKYALENNYSKDKLECAFAATNNVIDFYTENKKALGRVNSIEKLIKTKDTGRLKVYIKSRI